jgi:hypothetical protein
MKVPARSIIDSLPIQPVHVPSEQEPDSGSDYQCSAGIAPNHSLNLLRYVFRGMFMHILSRVADALSGALHGPIVLQLVTALLQEIHRRTR